MNRRKTSTLIGKTCMGPRVISWTSWHYFEGSKFFVWIWEFSFCKARNYLQAMFTCVSCYANWGGLTEWMDVVMWWANMKHLQNIWRCAHTAKYVMRSSEMSLMSGSIKIGKATRQLYFAENLMKIWLMVAKI